MKYWEEAPLWVSKEVSRDECSDHAFVTIGTHPGDHHYEQMIGSVYGRYEDGEDAIANARLWAASYDMFSALEMLIPLAEKAVDTFETIGAQNQARAAVAEAREAMRIAKEGRPEDDYKR